MAKRAQPARQEVARGKVRCAIYTRKSTDEGLEQEFNSLDAQREACAAYILSQRHEGWTLVPDTYDDGGFSGGTMARPGMQRLLGDLEAGRVDVIVVYKVDRLTRSLSDFARIVELLDARGASFVSITQSFNTTTSMGRLTLNVLLSFAQFEREVTGERIRDKIAASRRKGMWMGGNPALGYDVQDRKLVVNQEEAEQVRHMMRRYVELGSARLLLDELRAAGCHTKSRAHGGNVPFRRGSLYHLLGNPLYIGKVVHKGSTYDGQHEAIVSADLWQRVQAQLSVRDTGRDTTFRKAAPHLLTGRLLDAEGRRMSPTHTSKGGRRYRYYVTHQNELDPDEPAAAAARVAALDLEALVLRRLHAFLADRNAIVKLRPHLAAGELDIALRIAASLCRQLQQKAEQLAVLQSLVSQVRLGASTISIAVDVESLTEMLRLPSLAESQGDEPILLTAEAARIRQGQDVRLIIGDGQGKATGERNLPLVQLLAEARLTCDSLLQFPERSITQLARETGRCRKRVARLVRIATLAPDIIERCLAGTQPVDLTTAKLFQLDLPVDWTEQRRILGVAS